MLIKKRGQVPYLAIDPHPAVVRRTVGEDIAC